MTIAGRIVEENGKLKFNGLEKRCEELRTSAERMLVQERAQNAR